MQVIVDGLLTAYEKAGKGKTILLLHGWGDSAATYKGLVRSLENNYQLLLLNLPGFGGSQTPKEVWDLGDYSKFVSSWLKKIEEKNIFAIIGHSNGGAVAVYGLAAGELKAEKLILLASAGIRNQKSKTGRIRMTVVKAGKVATLPLPTGLKTKLKTKVYTASGSEALLYPELEETFKKIVSHDIRSYAAKLSVPTLLVYGAEDSATPPNYGEKLDKQIKDSELRIINGAGHFVHHDAGAQTEELVKEFLEK